MAGDQQPTGIWAQMSYTPPRGPCSQKTSVLSTCSCYRFMIHPLKAATSFDCDGCGHHASFHKMDNPQDEETARRWKEVENAQVQEPRRIAGLLDMYGEVEEIVPPKRRRLEKGNIYGQYGETLNQVTAPSQKTVGRKRANGG